MINRHRSISRGIRQDQRGAIQTNPPIQVAMLALMGAAALTMGLVGCDRSESTELGKKLDDISTRLAALENWLGPSDDEAAGVAPSTAPKSAGPVVDVATVIALAKQSLESQEPDLSKVDQALEAIEQWETAGPKNPELETLKAQLLAQQCASETDEAVRDLQGQLDASSNIPDPRAVGLAHVQIKTTALLLKLDVLVEQQKPTIVRPGVTTNPPLAELGRRLDQIVDAVESKQQEAIKQYQQWALQRIKRFSEQYTFDKAKEGIKKRFESFESPAGPTDWSLLRDLPEVRNFFQEKTGVLLPDSGELTVEKQKEIYQKVGRWLRDPIDLEPMAYRVVREGLIECMLPIDLSQLERPVQQLHDKYYGEAWKKLDDVPLDQEYVAEQTVKLHKVTVEDVLAGKAPGC